MRGGTTRGPSSGWMSSDRGRCRSRLGPIMLHGSSATGSEAGPVIEAFVRLSQSDQDVVVSFLLTLRLPVEASAARQVACHY
jgi:hypothetical protein